MRQTVRTLADRLLAKGRCVQFSRSGTSAGSAWNMLRTRHMLWTCQEANEVGRRGSVFLSEYQGHGMGCALRAVENRPLQR